MHRSPLTTMVLAASLAGLLATSGAAFAEGLLDHSVRPLAGKTPVHPDKAHAGNGQLIPSYGSTTKSDAVAVIAAIERALKAPRPATR